MINILLLGAGGNAGINYVKSLKLTNNFNIIGVDVNDYNLRACNSDVKILASRLDPLEKVKFINNLIQTYDISFIHAQPDVEVEFLCKFNHLLNTKTFNHSIDEWNIFNNKGLCQNAWKNKFNFDFTCIELCEIDDDVVTFDKIRKNNKAWIRYNTGAGSRAALPIYTLEEGIFWAKYWSNNKGLKYKNFIVSDFLPGSEYAVQLFFIEGELIHSQARKRIEYIFEKIMPSGQSSTPAVAETISDIRVYNRAIESVKVISKKPHGIYSVDLKENYKGEIIPMEVNYGRFFTTSDFFSQLGVNTPAEYTLFGVDNDYKPQKKNNSIKEKRTWLRGLDREPYLI